MFKKIRSNLGHPLVVLVILVTGIGWGWHVYTQSARNLSVATHNMLPNGGLDQFDARSMPVGWTIQQHGAAQYRTSKTSGYVAGSSFSLSVSDYKDGDVTLFTPRVPVQPHTTYLYKGYYVTQVSFDLLAKYYYKDGTSRLEIVRDYPHQDDPWSTVSTAFNSGDNVQAVQFAYRAVGNGTLQLDDTYLEARDPADVFIEPDIAGGVNHAPQFADWQPYHYGDNNPTFASGNESGRQYLHTALSGYKTGEAKWEYAPQPVVPGQYFEFGVDYRSSAAADVVIEYTLASGQSAFDTLTSLKPAGEWTHYTGKFEVPFGAQTMFVSVVGRANGSIDTSDYSLNDITKAGILHFKQPLVSLTFDDGWQSVYDNGLPLLQKYGYAGTFYINPGSVGEELFMDIDQLQQVSRLGNQIASHGYDHLDMTSINQHALNFQLQTARGYFEKNFGLHGQDFATPYGKSDPESQAVIRANYRSHRTTATGINTKQNFDPYNLRVLFLQHDTPLSTIQDALNDAKAYNGWLILVYHRIEDKPGSEMFMSPKDFAQQLQAIHQTGITVRTVHDALDELGRQ